jgi:hypothetical protein
MRSIQGDLDSQSAATTVERRSTKPFRRDRNELRNDVVRMSCKVRSTSGSGGTWVLEPGAGGSDERSGILGTQQRPGRVVGSQVLRKGTNIQDDMS